MIASEFCSKNCLGSHRPFIIHVYDNFKVEAIQIIRPYKCKIYNECFSCLNCCKDEIEIQSPVGETIGYVKQLYEGCYIKYAIMNHLKDIVLRLHGPHLCYCYCPGDDVLYELMTADGITQIGKISKQWSNLFKEMFTDADNFGIQFPLDLDTRIKAVVLGAVFLIDFMYFENKGSEKGT